MKMSFLGTEAQTSSLKPPLKTPAEGLGLLFFLMDESVGTCFEQHCFVCKIFKIPGFSLDEFSGNLFFSWSQLKVHGGVKCMGLVLVVF